MKQVLPLYMSKSELFSCKSIVTKVGVSEIAKKRYQWIQLTKTIFHPKGGGQPSDIGTIDSIQVVAVHKEISDKNRLNEFEILHCFDENTMLSFKEGDEVQLWVDPVMRKLHSQLHTAGHLVAEAAKKNFPELEPFQGNHYPDTSFVRCRMTNTTKTYDKEEIKRTIESEIRAWIEQDLPVLDQLSPNGLRSIKITHDWSPCGGTHINCLKALGSVEIPDLSINKKEEIITIKYITNSRIT